MKNKKIKVFLGGYVNSINAQNLNCLALAKYLDKDRFEVGVLKLHSGSLNIENLPAKIFKTQLPHRLWRYYTYFRGILWCDVAYLPKGEIHKFCKFLLRIFKKKSFTTVEGVISGSNLKKSLNIFKSEDGIRDSYHFTTKTYAITHFMAKKNKELLNIKSDGVLYLGIDMQNFKEVHKKSNIPKNIVFIGNNMRYKGIDDIYKIAKRFDEITFHIVGGGMGYDAKAEIMKRGLRNVVYHGLLNHNQLSELLSDMDLHIFPSRSEGFPKVTLETAAAGVPSVVYGDYGADEWITNEEDGYVVDKLDEIIDIVKDLKIHPEKLPELSSNVVKMALKFDWKKQVKNWENVIVNLTS